MRYKRFEKIVEWEKDRTGFLMGWIILLGLFIIYPYLYFTTMRKVYFREVKETGK